MNFNESGDGSITLPQDCHAPISCHVLQNWVPVTLWWYNGSYGVRSIDLKGGESKCEINICLTVLINSIDSNWKR